MQYEIVALPKEQWKGTTIPLTTRSDSYYDFEIKPLDSEGCTSFRNTTESELVENIRDYIKLGTDESSRSLAAVPNKCRTTLT